MTINADLVRNPYIDYQETVREVFAQVLSRPAFPLSARLFSMACFAFEADAAVASDGPGFTEAKLADEVNKVADYVYERLWVEEFNGKSVDPERPMSMIQSLLLGRVRTCTTLFNQMIMATWSEYITEKGSARGGAPLLDIKSSKQEIRVKCADLTRQYVDRRDRLFAILGREIDHKLQDFCTRFILSREYSTHDTHIACVQRLMLQVALLKYFLVSDPDLAVGIRRIDPGPSGNRSVTQEDRESLGRAVSIIIQRTECHLEQESNALGVLQRALLDQGMQDLFHTALFVFF